MSLSSGLIPLNKDSGGSKKSGGLTGGLIPLGGGGGAKLVKEPSDFDFDRDDLSPASDDGGGFDSAFSDLLAKPTAKGACVCCSSVLGLQMCVMQNRM